MANGCNHLEVAQPAAFRPKAITVEELLTLEKLWRRVQKGAIQPKFYAEVEQASILAESEKAVLVKGLFRSKNRDIRGSIWSPKGPLVALQEVGCKTFLIPYSFFKGSLTYAASTPELSEMSGITKDDVRDVLCWAFNRYYERRDLKKPAPVAPSTTHPFPEPNWEKLSLDSPQTELF